MKNRLSKLSNPSVIALFIAIIASSFGSFIIVSGVSAFYNFHSNFVCTFLGLSLGTAVTSAFYTGIHRGTFMKTLNPFVDPKSLIAGTGIYQGIVVMLFISKIFSLAVAYSLISVHLIWSTWLGFSIATHGMKVNKKYLKNIPWWAATLVGSFTFVNWHLKNFWSLDKLIVACSLWQAIIHTVGLAAIMAWFTAAKSFRLDKNSLKNSFLMRVERSEFTFSTWTTSLVVAVFQVFAIVAFILWRGERDNAFPLIFASSIQFLFIPALIESWQQLNQVGIDQERLFTFSKLTVQSARKLLLRHNTGQKIWAATIGLRTSTYLIDHDPVSVVCNVTPSTIVRIRSEELLSFVTNLTEGQSLAVSSLSQKILGTMDPEQSIRPCVDTMNLFATLYLDASIIVEKRISGLVALLPIVNPGLAKALNVEALSHALKRTQWFFYFDYSWVDQSIFNSPTSARYGVHIDPLSPEAKLAILDLMRKSHSLGNFIWIGKSAHDRLLQEAPNLISIMEPHNLKIANSQDQLVFSAKFEQLIPRLQRYYGLDHLRAKIQDYEPSAESQRLLNIISNQIKNSATAPDQKRAIDSLKSYRWHGFKEKDQALGLLLRIYDMHKTPQQEPLDLDQENDPVIEDLKHAASAIGYPSQLMNQATMFKLQLRDLKKLRHAALATSHPRFEEAWVLLGNFDYSRFSERDISTICELLNDARVNSRIMLLEVVQAKIIDAASGIIRRRNTSTSFKDLELLLNIINTLITSKAKAETMTLALDALAFASHLTKIDLKIPQNIINYFESHSQQVNNTSSPWEQSLASRWHEFKSVEKMAAHGTIAS